VSETYPVERRRTAGNSLDRIGYYCWGGPGTVRMIEVKYFNPRIDIHSLMTCYDYDYVARVKDLFDVTDFWVTYSWGFNDETEEEDRRFIIDRLDNFKKLGIRTHAYIQGPNLVYDDFPGVDWWARDERGRLIPYYKGRKMCSIHNEGYVQYVVDKIEATYDLGFDGIYVDNIQHGQLGMPTQPGVLPFVFCGDRSEPAREAFRRETGCDIPEDLERDLDLTAAYLDFRVQSNTAFISRLADVAHAGGMEFGTNFYDPKFDPTFIYAFDMVKLAQVQDYILFENHALPSSDGKVHNEYIEQLVETLEIDAPVFVVSYRNGVGMAPQFTQEELDNLYSEAAHANFHLCLKGGEFTTRKLWHSLYLDDLARPRQDKDLPRLPNKKADDVLQVAMRYAPLRSLLKRYYNPLYHAAFEWRALRLLVNLAYDLVLKY
jgi:hypothetical protein